jgi:hypothetical protein
VVAWIQASVKELAVVVVVVAAVAVVKAVNQSAGLDAIVSKNCCNCGAFICSKAAAWISNKLAIRYTPKQREVVQQ